MVGNPQGAASREREPVRLGPRLEALIDRLHAPLADLAARLDAIVAGPASALSGPVELLFSLSYVGRSLAMLWRLLLSVAWAVARLPYGLLALADVKPEMKLRVQLLYAADPERQASSQAELMDALAVAEAIFVREANVRLVPVEPSGHGETAAPGGQPIPFVMEDAGFAAGKRPCNLAALGDDLAGFGGRVDRAARSCAPRSGYRRISGWGAPLTIVLVEGVEDGLVGCSLGPLTDYVTLAADNPLCAAHELAHACNLWHRREGLNLMNPTCGGIHLTRWQVALLRLSRHVTFL